MNILCVYGEQLNIEEFSGWGKALISCGHEFLFFKQKEKSILDAFYEKKPDLFITCESAFDRATKKAINLYPKCKVIIFYKNTSFLENKNFHENVYCLNSFDPSVDIYPLLKGKLKANLISDINYVGEYIDDNDNVILNTLSENGFIVKVWGEKKWPYRQYLGKAKENLVKDIIMSCSLSVSSDLFSGEIWPLKVFASGKPCILYRSAKTKDLIGADNFNYEDEESFFKAIIDLLQNPDSLNDEVERINKDVRNNHTSHNRVAKLFNIMGMEQESDKCLLELKKILEKY